MNPFYFGTAERALFGVYHPPRVRGGSMEGAVLCYPWGVEYMRAHRAFRQMTTLLTRAGVHVLRFDYGGTGDSTGMGEDQTLEQWREDVATAIEELKDTAGLDRVSLIGLRLGGTLAAQVVEGRTDISRLVLWDPVVSGEHYLSDLLALEGEEGFGAGKDVIGIQGFPLTRILFEQIRQIDLSRADLSPECAVDIVVSHEHPRFDLLRDRLSSTGAHLHHEVVPSQGNWAEGDAFGAALLPEGIIQTIVDRISGVGVQ